METLFVEADSYCDCLASVQDNSMGLILEARGSLK